ncbi:hypothetical protein SAMN04487843_105124 [Methylobacterium sp. ap11]|uniref:hypothetical protein n=1 Tax=Methylobacterium sp. ap11 TaxID=1761799 RepID=UPI0008C9F1DE|nr:hypothetical protein [Methylobacterium sp. ap11]SEO94354.1 hypothetical protein SAMN04487843_105124 [Methylobacterium sp. ap11]
MLVRSVALALVLAAAPAATKPGAAVPVELSFPAAGDRFLLSVRGPVEAGRSRFARLYASPAGRDGWTTTIVCGTADLRGRERVEAQGAGSAWLDRGKLAGTWSPVGGGYGEAQMRVWSVDQQDGLDVVVSMSGPCPGRGRGELSSGD